MHLNSPYHTKMSGFLVQTHYLMHHFVLWSLFRLNLRTSYAAEKKSKPIVWRQQIHSGCPNRVVSLNTYRLSTSTQIHHCSYASSGTRM